MTNISWMPRHPSASMETATARCLEVFFLSHNALSQNAVISSWYHVPSAPV